MDCIEIDYIPLREEFNSLFLIIEIIEAIEVILFMDINMYKMILFRQKTYILKDQKLQNIFLKT
jgi:hypothetical protein